MKGPPDGALTRWERQRLLLLAMQTANGLTLSGVHRFLGGHFGLKEPTRNEYLEDMSELGFIQERKNKFYATKIARNHFKLDE